jgi:pimeloyl-ACP methyl ester carboxylesterase
MGRQTGLKKHGFAQSRPVLFVATVLLTPPVIPAGATDPATLGAGLSRSDTETHKQHLQLGNNHTFMTVYANRSITTASSHIKNAIIVIHGAGRDADEYFRSAMAAAYLSAALADTLVVAPRFAASDGSADCADPLEKGELRWGCESWKVGGTTADLPSLSSFGAIDILVKAITRPDLFPGLSHLVVVGHSAGGQFVSRYALLNRVDESLPLKPVYVPTNASSYLYLDRGRPDRPQNMTRPHTPLSPEDVLPRALEFHAAPDPQGCLNFNAWPYGLEDVPSALLPLGAQDLERAFASRQIIFAVGQIDNVALAGLDTSCSAGMQGANRLERAISYWQHGNTAYGSHHRLIIVPLCGHNARCLFTSPVLMPILFPESDD